MSVLCLVPSLVRALRGARRLCDAQGGILFGPRVVTPLDCVPALLADAGERRPLLTPLAERFLALEASRTAGDPFSPLASASGLSRSLASTLAELRASRVPVDALESSAQELEGQAGHRLRGLAATLRAYQARLDRGLLDRAGALTAAAEAVQRGASSEATANLDLLLLEGFHNPSLAEWDLLSALAEKAQRIIARVPFFPERPDLSRPAEPFLRRIEALHDLAASREIEVSLARIEGERAPRPAHLLRAVAGGGVGPVPQGGRVEGWPGAGELGEAQVAARLAAELIEAGQGPEEVVFLSPAPSRAAPLLARACQEMGVPFAAGRGTALASAPPIRAIREAMTAAAHFNRGAVERLAASSYFHLADVPARLSRALDRAGAIEGRNDLVEALERRVRELNAPSARSECAGLSRAAQALSKMRAALTPLSLGGTAKEHAARLRAFLFGAGVRRQAARAEPELARRDLSAISRLEILADDLAWALGLAGRGEERIEPDRYLELLDTALQGASMPTSSEPAAGAVELWSLSEAPGLTVRSAILVGCGRGSWPPAPSPEPILRDPERVALNRALRRAALATTAARRADSVYLAFSAMAAGREAVLFTWAGAGPGGDGGPAAPLVVEALASCGALPDPAPQADPVLGGARSQPEALRATARLSRLGQGSAALAALGEVSPAMVARASSALARGAMESERRAAVLDCRPAPSAGLLPPALAPVLADALPAEWTPTQLETFANCPYQFFLGQLLRLPDRDGVGLDIDPRD